MSTARRFWILVGICAAAALAIRLGLVLVVRPTCGASGPDGHCFNVVNDSWYGHEQAELIWQGHWFVDPYQWVFNHRDVASAGDPPLYALYLAFSNLFGLGGQTGHRIASALAGTAGVVLVGMAARRFAGDRAGVIAAALAAVHPLLWINDGMLLSESLYVPLIALVLLLSIELWHHPDARHAAGLGFAIALATLTRGEAGLLVVALLVPLVVLAKGVVGSRWKLAGIGVLAAALPIIPWVAWNNTRFNEPVTLTADTGAVLSAGACDATFSGPFLGYYANCFQGTVPPGLDESERDKVVRTIAVDYLKDHASELPKVVLARIGRAWTLFRPFETTRYDWQIEGRGRLASQAGLAMYAALLPLSAVGLVVLRRRRVPILPFVAIAIMVTVTAAMFFGLTRYRVPADVAMVVLGGVAVDALVARWWPGRSVARPAPDPVEA